MSFILRTCRTSTEDGDNDDDDDDDNVDGRADFEILDALGYDGV